MAVNNIELSELENLLVAGVPLIDVRAPIEFHQGHLPGAVNVPILNDEERALIGTIYKQQGNEAAVKKGYELVSGEVKASRVQQWLSYTQKNPNVVLYCFRGGQRSRITQAWLREAGVERPLIVGGYKRVRQFFIDQLNQRGGHGQFLCVSGPTGSGKTDFLRHLEQETPVLDLEKGACHRGSAFGAMTEAQPSQVNFENEISLRLLRLARQFGSHLPILVEDESRMIGRVCIPEKLFLNMRSSSVIWIDEPLAVRVENIFKDYILQTAIGASLAEEASLEGALGLFDRYDQALIAIQKKLGGLRTQEVRQDLSYAKQQFRDHRELVTNKVWIEKLLNYYYDPLYLGSLERRQVNVVFKGSTLQAQDFVRSLK